jgi:hypothetical protein
MMVKKYWLGLSRKAKWLIVWSVLYSLIAGMLLAKDTVVFLETGVNGDLWDRYGIIVQLPWLVIMASPLWLRSLGDWVFKRRKVLKER